MRMDWSHDLHREAAHGELSCETGHVAGFLC